MEATGVACDILSDEKMPTLLHLGEESTPDTTLASATSISPVEHDFDALIRSAKADCVLDHLSLHSTLSASDWTLAQDASLEDLLQWPSDSPSGAGDFTPGS